MEEIIIYKYQLEKIIEMIKLTSKMNESSKKITCYDRMVIQSLSYAENALSGDKDKFVMM